MPEHANLDFVTEEEVAVKKSALQRGRDETGFSACSDKSRNVRWR